MKICYFRLKFLRKLKNSTNKKIEIFIFQRIISVEKLIFTTNKIFVEMSPYFLTGHILFFSENFPGSKHFHEKSGSENIFGFCGNFEKSIQKIKPFFSITLLHFASNNLVSKIFPLRFSLKSNFFAYFASICFNKSCFRNILSFVFL